MTLRLRCTEDDYVAALKSHAAWSRRRTFVHLALALLAVVVIVSSFPRWPAVAGGAVLGSVLGIGVCFGISWFFYLPWKARHVFRQQKSLHEEYELSWGDDGLCVRGARVQSTVPWDNFVKKKWNDRIVMLYHSDLLFQMLPLRCFDDESWRSLAAYLERIPPQGDGIAAARSRAVG